MIRIYSIKQALSLRGTIPEIAIIRSIQFQGDGYDPMDDGHIIVLEGGDRFEEIEELGCRGLYDEDEIPTYEYVESFMENGRLVYEVVFQNDDSRTIAVIIPDEPWLQVELRADLQRSSLPPRPLPQLQKGAS